MEYVDIKPIYSNYDLIRYDKSFDLEAIKNSLINIFTISKGQLGGHPNFGNPLDLSLFDFLGLAEIANIEGHIKQAILEYEPRIVVDKVTVFEAEEYNRFIIEIEFHYTINNEIQYDSLSIPYAHNTLSYLGGRIRPLRPVENPNECEK
jgi:phage baseplate assembly protein W